MPYLEAYVKVGCRLRVDFVAVEVRFDFGFFESLEVRGPGLWRF